MVGEGAGVRPLLQDRRTLERLPPSAVQRSSRAEVVGEIAFGRPWSGRSALRRRPWVKSQGRADKMLL
jgi:hypothetical protein